MAPETFGSYFVYEQLGMGGMASVHVAESRSSSGFRKRVALKRLHDHAADDPTLVDAFVREARLDARLHHPNITQTFDFGQVDGTYFIAMELVSGPTLSQLMKQCIATVGLVPIPVALHILVHICAALDYAHTLTDEKGQPLKIVHRDVSPPNIIIANSGVVKLIDFGVHKQDRSEHTQAGVIKGKLSYLPPEYLASHQLDMRTDLWSLGVVAHELLTSRRLFEGPNDLVVLEAIRESTISPPSRHNPSVSKSLDAIVMTALERDVGRRWQSSRAMLTALRNEITDLGAEISPRQVMAWVEWAFSQTTRQEHSGVNELLAMIEQPKPPMIVIDPDPDTATIRPAATFARRDKEPKLPIKPSRLRGHLRARWWLIALLVLVAAAAVAVDHFGLDRTSQVLKEAVLPVGPS